MSTVHSPVTNSTDATAPRVVRTALLSVWDKTGVTDLAWAGDISWSDLLDPGSLTWSPDGRGIAYTFVDCDLLTPSGGCSRMRSVRYVSLDGVEAGILVHDARDPSWRR